jgi:hypothetical protein
MSQELVVAFCKWQDTVTNPMPVGSLAEPVSNPSLGPHSVHYSVATAGRQYSTSDHNTIQRECAFFCQARVIKYWTAWNDLFLSIYKPMFKRTQRPLRNTISPHLILTPTFLGTVCKAIPRPLLDVSMWIGIIFNFSYRTGTNLSMKHSVFISVTGLWIKYIK